MTRCPKCNHEQTYFIVTCDCGFELQTHRLQLKEQEHLRTESSRPYNLMPILRVALRLIGFLSILGGMIYAVLLFLQENPAGSVFAAFLGGFVMSIPYFSAGKAITTLINMSDRQDKLRSMLEKIEREKVKTLNLNLDNNLVIKNTIIYKLPQRDWRIVRFCYRIMPR